MSINQDIVENPRELRGLTIAKKDRQIKRIDGSNYEALSQSGNESYLVALMEDGWICECPDHKFRDVKCKHIWGVEFSIALRKTVETTRIEPIINPQVCQMCGSERVVRDGVRHNKSGDIQLYCCKDCGTHFTINLGFEGMKSTPQIITSALHLPIEEICRGVTSVLCVSCISRGPS